MTKVRTWILSVLSVAVWTIIISDAQAQTATSPSPPFRIKQVKQDIVVSADGRHVSTTTTQFQVLNAGVTAQVSQVPVAYDAMLQDAEISNAYTLKPDGQKIPVDPNNILTQKPAAPAGQNSLAPVYTDAEQKIIIFPNVLAGDTMVFTAKISDKSPFLSGQFTLSHYFNTTVEADDASYSLTVPNAMPVNVASGNMVQDKSVQDGMTTYRWNFSNTATKASPVSLVSDPRAGMYFLASSYKDYDALAHDYSQRIQVKVAATPAIQKQADAITQGISDRQGQARAIYDWVNQHVRYVGIEFGIGGIIPHDPDWTLSNGFGDCKDQAVLYASLLKAKNIPAELVLINAGNRYKLSGVPTASEFNHVIVWLPDFKAYADTTAPGMPFQLLPVPDYGKPVLHLVQNGPAQHQTPVVPAGAVTSMYKVHAVFNAQGVDADASITATGSWASALRVVAGAIQVAGPVSAAANVLKAHNFPNATGSFNPISTSGVANGFEIASTYHLSRPGPQGNVLALANAMGILPRAGDGPMGPLNNKTISDTDETPCYGAHQTEDVIIDLSNGDHLAALPADAHVKTANIAYDTHWSESGNSVTLHREFVSTISDPVCTGKVRQDTAEALAKIRDDYAAPARLAAKSGAASPASN